jgi:hypothetical protein
MITMLRTADCFGFIHETNEILVEEVIQYYSPTAPKVFHETRGLLPKKVVDDGGNPGQIFYLR